MHNIYPLRIWTMGVATLVTMAVWQVVPAPKMPSKRKLNGIP